jgi:hypothetical protein
MTEKGFRFSQLEAESRPAGAAAASMTFLSKPWKSCEIMERRVVTIDIFGSHFDNCVLLTMISHFMAHVLVLTRYHIVVAKELKKLSPSFLG